MSSGVRGCDMRSGDENGGSGMRESAALRSGPDSHDIKQCISGTCSSHGSSISGAVPSRSNMTS